MRNLDEGYGLRVGNTISARRLEPDVFGEDEMVMYLKAGRHETKLRLDVLRKLAALETLSECELLRHMRTARLDPDAPSPPLEALLHAVMPGNYVHHTQPDAVIALLHTPDGETLLREVYGERVLFAPDRVTAAKLVQHPYDGVIVMQHGLFTWGETARESFDRMTALVTLAENYLKERGASDSLRVVPQAEIPKPDLLALSHLRKAGGQPMIARLLDDPEAVGFASLPNVDEIATRGPLMPDHAQFMKRIPVILSGSADDFASEIRAYTVGYRDYIQRNSVDGLSMISPTPSWAVWRERGIAVFGENVRAADITADLVCQTIRVIQWVEHISRWQPLPEKAIFAAEYAARSQAENQEKQGRREFAGKIALVTGAASGIGRACAQMLSERGAAVVALDINPQIQAMSDGQSSMGLVCDMTDPDAIASAVDETVRQFGGLEIVVSNAGIFPPSSRIEAMDAGNWTRSLDINLTSHQRLMQYCIPYLKNGFDPAVVVIGSKNFPAPGPGAAAYSVAKAGVTQLVRVAALELAQFGIRVNVVHPDAVFDTGLWTPEILAKRAQHYNLTVEQYKTKNLLGVEITSRDVAELVCAMAGQAFSRTTGAQVPIDGGNDRVI